MDCYITSNHIYKPDRITENFDSSEVPWLRLDTKMIAIKSVE